MATWIFPPLALGLGKACAFRAGLISRRRGRTTPGPARPACTLQPGTGTLRSHPASAYILEAQQQPSALVRALLA
ncbi:hypothetical protein NDU88_001451 [Pleurodeles waltl]|uniref:Uncharacterized protein n=1 Tax=Pleurodeles waltl TaxID=8319 RepID=A0AAV7S8N0_PLEWA|nr:hypothetical protein NDU88_001451 [Pleurodeles waltl]